MRSPAALVLCIAALAALLARGKPSVVIALAPADDPAARPRLMGVASCAASACHGHAASSDESRSAYVAWSENDPHARAYHSLLTEKAQVMTRLYRRKLAARPAQDELCLNCHVYPGIKQERHAERFTYNDGVGCEACHGPAEHWLAAHYRRDWSRRSDQADLHFRQTKNLLLRAQTCVDCHVGTDQAEVNHDLIAAGHPPLFFEFVSHLARLPKHWSRTKDQAGRADFEARAWAVGQATTGAAAARLLAARAHGRGGKPWPELADHDCLACHQDLRPGGRTGAPAAAMGRAGVNPWPFAMIDFTKESQPALTSILEKLRARLVEPSAKSRDDIAPLCRELHQLLETEAARANAQPLSADEVRAQWRDLRARKLPRAETSWLVTLQLERAWAAHYRALRDLGALDGGDVRDQRYRDVIKPLNIYADGIQGGRQTHQERLRFLAEALRERGSD